ncbi:aspartic peptidase domain-containing protein [Russula ochroleuca]|uniref:Aspartic peptidase domain-containing protein n=1 Tax=Russula ochroleuca TaxID=152965 RepID=A0A9P5T5M6_9AGAM|nr:aspartic peptidase domain-containing protein [Russula ochroleuca]
MASFSTLCISVLVLLLDLNFASPVNSPERAVSALAQAKRSFDLPIRRTALSEGSWKRGTDSGSTGLGDFLDLFYMVPITIGEIETAVILDTGSSDLWVVSDACNSTVCENTNMPPYPSADIKPAGGSVTLLYGDSSTGTHASGPVAQDVAAIAGLSMSQQPFAAISDTNSTAVMHGSNGIFGLGFPSGSQVQATVIDARFNNPSTTDDFILGTVDDGPLLSRFAMSGSLEQPMFSVMLQRDIIDVSGSNGSLTVGKLPDGIDNSSLTWVPVRLYGPADGGLNPPQFAPDEIYPFRWEVPIEGVILDGQVLPASNLSGSNSGLSALLDTGNSVIRGPNDVVDYVLTQVSSAFADNSDAAPTFPCSAPHDLAFQIGGKTFPVDPRDFMSQNTPGDASTCVADHVVATDPPRPGALFSWSLGDPFFKSNLVAFYYGNLTYPSVDPPRIGFLSMVPVNANSIVQSDVAQAQANGGMFGSAHPICFELDDL